MLSEINQVRTGKKEKKKLAFNWETSQMNMATLLRTRNARTVGEGVAKLLCRVSSDLFSGAAGSFPYLTTILPLKNKI